MEPYATKLKREREARRCTSKNRYTDEFTARAMGQCQEERHGLPLWLYRCDLCRGWHLTKHPQSAGWKRVTYDYSTSSQPNADGFMNLEE